MSASVDVLLISPASALVTPFGDSKGGWVCPPLGLGYLAAVLEQQGYRVAIVDMQGEGLGFDDLPQILQTYQPRVVGFGTIVLTYKNSLRAAEMIKQLSPTTKVVLGGPHVMFLVEETLACSAVDVIVLGEGEETLVELMQYFDAGRPALDQIRGIAFRDGDTIHQTEQRPLIADLDSLPFPARHLFNMEHYLEPGALITGRGCPQRCVFCAAPTLYRDPPYRARSPQSVVDEITEIVERFGVRTIAILDDTFTMQPKRAEQICDMLIERNLSIRWASECRVDTMKPELARKMRDAGCYLVQYGVETGSPEIMKLIRKGIQIEKVKEVVNYSLELGLDVNCSFIVGYPWDTLDTIRQTADLALYLSQLGRTTNRKDGKQRGRVLLSYTPLTPLPGTLIYEQAEELGIRYLTRDWDQFTFLSPVIETAHVSASEIKEVLASFPNWTPKIRTLSRQRPEAQPIAPKITLVYPCCSVPESVGNLPPLEVAYLAAYLRENCATPLDINVIDANAHNFTVSETLLKIRTLTPGAVVVVLPNAGTTFAYELTEAIKLWNSQVIVMHSGPYATALPQDSLQSGADYCILGEAEETCAELLHALIQGDSPATIAGLAFKDAEVIVHTPARLRLEDLDALPVPAWDLFDQDAYTAIWPFVNGEYVLPLLSRRTDSDAIPAGVTLQSESCHFRSPANVVAEIMENMLSYGVSNFDFYDDDFLVSPDWVKAFCQELQDSIVCNWTCRVSVMRLNQHPELLSHCKQAGCIGFNLSIATIPEERFHEVEVACLHIARAGFKSLNLEGLQQQSALLERLLPVLASYPLKIAVEKHPLAANAA